MSHVETVQNIYAAFGQGDVPGLLAKLADDVQWDVWDVPSKVQEHVPYLAPRVGPAQVGEFFGALVGSVDVERFDVTHVIGDGDTVVALINPALIVKATGKRIEDLEVHVWTFGDDGKVTALRHVVDTLKHAHAQRSA
jgi:ketosteroid isomerase-like protein